MKRPHYIIGILIFVMFISGCKKDEIIETPVPLEEKIYWGMSKTDLSMIVDLEEINNGGKDHSDDVFTFCKGKPNSIFGLQDEEALYMFCQNKLISISYSYYEYYDEKVLDNIYNSLSQSLFEKYGETTEQKSKYSVFYYWETDVTQIKLSKDENSTTISFDSIDDFYVSDDSKPKLYKSYFKSIASSIDKTKYTYKQYYNKLVDQNIEFECEKPSNGSAGYINIVGQDNDSVRYYFHYSPKLQDNYDDAELYEIVYTQNGNSITATTYYRGRYDASVTYITKRIGGTFDNLTEKEAESIMFLDE